MSARHCVIGWQLFSAHHAALPGHFPGRPVIPGVVILQHVHELLHQHWPQHSLRSLPVVKFLRPVLPEELLLLGIEPGTVTQSGIQGRFICRCNAQTVAQGSFVLHAYTTGRA